MNTLPSVCPFCHGELYVTHLYCRECDTNIEGRFVAGVFSQLKPEQLAFVENFVTRLNAEQLNFVQTFIRCEGKIKSMEAEMGLSYPTIRNRLNEVIEALGYEPGGADESSFTAISEARRLSILEELDAGRISAEEAMRMLNESEG
jgi:hypothetical protein